MQQPTKRMKTSDSHLNAIASSIETIGHLVKSIGQTHDYLLKVNKLIVKHVRDQEEPKVALNLSTVDTNEP
ncbi:hypothetical protein KQX54_020387 [Cotesia glomerata]|uniref:BLOC-1-related complex subunit 7 n=1 Tax=Cotesia glomerata TaxID=32391 RepID=A0AAV7IE24_COTGL|nr:hypothetical protein KQX54_020387 [Cotesia glomerata]